MYAAYFGFREMPFSILPDPRFLYLSRAHSMALSMLEYGVHNQAGFTVVTGAIGSGKTTLIQHLLRSVGQELHVGLMNHTPRRDDNLFEWLLLVFDQPIENRSYAGMYRQFCDFVSGVSESGGRVVLIVDEAQNLEPARLEELRMLSNLNSDVMILQLILVGQPELSAILSTPELRQFAQRISSDFHLPKLMPREVSAYIDHRLRFVNGNPSLIAPRARTLIAEAAEGIPRQVNILVDRCLAYVYGCGGNVVTARLVREVIDDRSRHGVFRTGPRLALT